MSKGINLNMAENESGTRSNRYSVRKKHSKAKTEAKCIQRPSSEHVEQPA